MAADAESCNFLDPTVRDFTMPTGELAFIVERKIVMPIYRRVRSFSYSLGSKTVTERDPINLQPGELAQVRSFDEIAATLDGKNKYKGLYFMPEMKQYCGGTFKVFKQVKTIKLESTGEIRTLRSPTVFLEGLYCDGRLRHHGCDRGCFHFWREAWLKRVPDGS